MSDSEEEEDDDDLESIVAFRAVGVFNQGIGRVTVDLDQGKVFKVTFEKW